MKKATAKRSQKLTVGKERPLMAQFAEVAGIVRTGRSKAYASVNAAVIETYWQVGRYISEKIEKAAWGQGVVQKLADYLQETISDPRGFSARNLWRMRQFHDLYGNYEKLSALLTQLSWTNHLLIISKAKSEKERLFYVSLSSKERYSSRDLERQIDAGLFERSLLVKPKMSRALERIHPGISGILRDSYSLDFIGLNSRFSEYDLRKGIVRSLKNFIIEFGRDFAFIGEEYRVQVGMKDFFLDLLFYHRELRCLVAFELKIDEFKPEYLGKLSFYLEALDRDVKKNHENPSIGIILCKGKDHEVVEYALSRTLSPAVIADYTTKLPDKSLLRDKLHEFFDNSVREIRAEYEGKTA
jgi:predicted nuclease of restriction endonuclease-like (RecB) superfamily